MKHMNMRIYDNGLADKKSEEYNEFINSQNLIEMEYEKSKRKLSREFAKIYEENDNFGDMCLTSLTIERSIKDKAMIFLTI